MIEDLFVPDPPSGDSSNRIPTTRFVQNAAASAAANFPVVGGLSVVGNASTASATAAAITDAAGNQLLVSNAANTTIIWSTVSSYIDNAISSTQGAILYRNAASWVPLAPGTQSTFLQTQGAAANPQWAAAGTLVLLNTLSPSSVATVGDTTSFTSAYRDYMITFENVCPATQSTTLHMQIATTGTAFIAAGYNCGNFNVVSTGYLLTTQIAVATVTSAGVNGSIVLFNPSRSGNFKTIAGVISFLTSSGNTTIQVNAIAGYQATATQPVTGAQFLFSSGNIQTGTIKIYGMT